MPAVDINPALGVRIERTRRFFQRVLGSFGAVDDQLGWAGFCTGIAHRECPIASAWHFKVPFHKLKFVGAGGMDHTNPGAPLVEISVEVGAIKCLGLSTDLSIRNRCDGFDGLREFRHPLVLQSCIDLLLGLVDGRFCRFQITFPCFTLRKHVGMGGRLLEDSGHSVERGHGLRGMHDPRQGVIVPSWNGVEFVVMATSTTDGLAQEGFSDRVELLVDDVGPHFGLVGLGQNFGTEA